MREEAGYLDVTGGWHEGTNLSLFSNYCCLQGRPHCRTLSAGCFVSEYVPWTRYTSRGCQGREGRALQYTAARGQLRERHMVYTSRVCVLGQSRRPCTNIQHSTRFSTFYGTILAAGGSSHEPREDIHRPRNHAARERVCSRSLGWRLWNVKCFACTIGLNNQSAGASEVASLSGEKGKHIIHTAAFRVHTAVT